MIMHKSPFRCNPKIRFFTTFFSRHSRWLVQMIRASFLADAARQNRFNTMQKHDDLIRLAVRSVYFQRDIIVRDIYDNSFVNSARYRLDVYRLTAESD